MLSRAKTRLLFFSALALLFLAGAASFIAISRSNTAQGWVVHTRDVQAAISQINTVITRAGRTRTEYVNSGDPGHLQEYQLALAQIPPTVGTAKRLLGDNQSQLEKLADLDKLIEQRLSLMQQSVALRQTGQSTLENQSRITQSIVSVAGQMDAIVQRMLDQEQYLLQRRESRWRAGERLAAAVLGVAFAVAIVFLVLHYRLLLAELGAREQAEASLRVLSGRLLRLQDDERRKFSRELHDSLGQYLASAKMNLDVLGQSHPGNPQIADCSQLLDHAVSETRTLSHLLHPPLLDETGFASAARWYVDGFSSRSGIQTSLAIPETFERLPPPVELAMFRILQEGLTNIHRHSKSTQAQVKVEVRRSDVALTIRDNGRGMSPDLIERFRADGLQVGVGLAGMRERLRELGGRVDIQSDAAGTVVTAVLPKVL
jgi:signal transduction histidine kinase